MKRLPLAMRKVIRPITHACTDYLRAWTQPPGDAVVNQQEFCVIGLRRTGNHAIIHWLRELYRVQGQNAGHLNNLIPNVNPYRYKYENLRDSHPEHADMMARYQQQAQGHFIPRSCLICSYEDYSLRHLAHQPRLERHHDLYLGRSGARWTLLILRDPFNLLASRLKSQFMDVNAPGKTVSDLWVEYAQEFVGETDWLRSPKLCINYNRWCVDSEYRQSLADTLQIPYQAIKTDKVSGCGGGSSFDGFAFQGQATAMDTQGRWRHYQDQPHYRALFKNSQLWHYGEQIFGHLDGTDVLREA